MLHHHLEWLLLADEFTTLYKGYDFSDIDKDNSTADQFLDWFQQLLDETAAAIPPESIQVRDAHRFRITLGGDDSVTEAFLDAILN
jgi:hypothetical protein